MGRPIHSSVARARKSLRNYTLVGSYISRWCGCNISDYDGYTSDCDVYCAVRKFSDGKQVKNFLRTLPMINVVENVQ